MTSFQNSTTFSKTQGVAAFPLHCLLVVVLLSLFTHKTANAQDDRIPDFPSEIDSRSVSLDSPSLSASASSTSNSISLSWGSINRATYYEIMVFSLAIGEGETQNLGTTSSTSYTHSGLVAGASYYYWIRAGNQNGETSHWSNRASATVISHTSTPTSTHTATSTHTPTLTPSSTPTPTHTPRPPRPTSTPTNTPRPPRPTATPTHTPRAPLPPPDPTVTPTPTPRAPSPPPDPTSTATPTPRAPVQPPAPTVTPTHTPRAPLPPPDPTVTPTPTHTSSVPPVPTFTPTPTHTPAPLPTPGHIIMTAVLDLEQRSVHVSWQNPSPPAAFYEVAYFDGQTDHYPTGNRYTETTFTHENVKISTKYTYYVRGYNQAGQHGNWAWVKITTPDQFPEFTPTPTLTHTITPSPTPTPTPTPTLTPTPTPTLTPTPTQTSTSTPTSTSTSTPTPSPPREPGKPSFTSAVVDVQAGTITLSWTQPDPPAERFEMVYDDPVHYWVYLLGDNYTATTYVFDIVEYNRRYIFHVRGWNGDLDGPFSSGIRVHVPAGPHTATPTPTQTSTSTPTATLSPTATATTTLTPTATKTPDPSRPTTTPTATRTPRPDPCPDPRDPVCPGPVPGPGPDPGPGPKP